MFCITGGGGQFMLSAGKFMFCVMLSARVEVGNLCSVLCLSARVVVYIRWRWAIYVLCYVECMVEVGNLCSVLC